MGIGTIAGGIPLNIWEILFENGPNTTARVGVILMHGMHPPTTITPVSKIIAADEPLLGEVDSFPVEDLDIAFERPG